jgi:PAS domain S-box-containing protein
MQVACTGVEVRDVEVDLVRAGRDARRLLCYARPLLDAAGRVRGSVGGFLDVTERKRAEEAIQLSHARFEALFNAAPLGVYLVDAGLRIRQVNPKARPVFGDIEGLIGSDFVEVIHRLWPQAYADEIVERFRHTLETGEPYVVPERIEERRDRKVTEYYEWQINRLLLPDGQYGVVCYFSDISRHVLARQALADSERALKEADRRKDEFLATLAHELRNPLAPLRNGLQLLRMAGDDRAMKEQAQGMMERQLTVMVRLIDDLLDVSRITRGKLQLRRERVDLASVVQSAVEGSRPLIESSAHQLTVALPPEPLPLDADPTRLAQVFANLLTNAAKYTDKGGRIGLTAERDGGEVVVSVRDTGIGIAAGHLPGLFELFSQVAPALERSQGGLGIGLSLVKGLVEMHGGSVEARSEGPGRGSEFVVRLPLLEGSPARESPHSASGEKATARPGRRILVADDNRDAANSLSLMLRLAGHQVHAVHDGQEAVDAAGWFRPDLALLDIGMPRLNGYEACRHIREQPWGGRVVLVAITGWGQEEDRRKAEEAGFDRHFMKPVDPASLEQLLAGLRPAEA